MHISKMAAHEKQEVHRRDTIQVTYGWPNNLLGQLNFLKDWSCPKTAFPTIVLNLRHCMVLK